MGICGHGTAEFVAAPPACARRAANGLQMLPYDEYTFIILHLSAFVNRIFQFFTPFGIIFLRGAKTVPVFADFAPFCAFFAFGHPRRYASCTFPLSARLPFKHEKKERTCVRSFLWRRERDLNSWIHSCITRFRIVRVRPLRHLCKLLYCTLFFTKKQVFLPAFAKKLFFPRANMLYCTRRGAAPCGGRYALFAHHRRLRVSRRRVCL